MPPEQQEDKALDWIDIKVEMKDELKQAEEQKQNAMHNFPPIYHGQQFSRQ